MDSDKKADKPNRPNRSSKSSNAVRPKPKRRPQGNQFQPPASTEGLAMRGLETRASNKSDWLATVNPYYASLVDPANNPNARVPDMCTTPSSTFTIVRKGEFQASASGVAAVTFGGSIADGTDGVLPAALQSCLIPTQVLVYDPGVGPYGTGGFYANGANSWLAGATTGPSATLTNIWNGHDLSSNTQNIRFEGWSSFEDIVPVTFDMVRLVSAVLTVSPTGTAISSSGRMIGVSLPRAATMRDDQRVLSVAELENKPGAQAVYVNANKAINVYYAPQDPASWTYADIPVAGESGNPGSLTFTVGQAPGGGDAGTPSGGFDTVSELLPYTPGELWVVVAGAQASQPFQFTLTANYEAIPRQAQTMLVPAHVSHADPMAAATALNAVAKRPRVLQGNANLVPSTAPPLRQHTGPPKTPMIERILGMVGKAGRIASTVAPMILSAI